MRYINFLRTCYPKVLRQVSFHFVYPISHPMRESEELAALLSGHSVTCEQDPKEYLQFLMQIQVQAAVKSSQNYFILNNLFAFSHYFQHN